MEDNSVGGFKNVYQGDPYNQNEWNSLGNYLPTFACLRFVQIEYLKKNEWLIVWFVNLWKNKKWLVSLYEMATMENMSEEYGAWPY